MLTRLLLAFFILAVVGSAATAAPGNPLDGLEQLKDFRAMRASSSDPNWKDGNGDARPIEPGATLTLADLTGPGQIAHIWCTIAATDKWYSKLLVLRMYWDGETRPSVECPIGDFFAQGHGMDFPVISIPVRVSSDGRARNCYWPMPFRKSARITVTNEGQGRVHAFYFYVDWQKKRAVARDAAYFHAQYRQQMPCQPDGKNYPILEAIGRGHYVGTVQSVRLNEPGWYGEGDDFFFIDGESEPSLRGTGTEDYFCDAWGFRKFDGPFYGVPLFEGFGTGDRSSVYRWHVPDPIPFTKSLRVEIEHKGSRDNVSGFIERYDDFATVAYWYQTEPHLEFPKMAPAADRLPYNIKDVTELETLLSRATAEPAEALKTQELGGGANQLFFTPGAANARLSIPLNVAKAGKYQLVLMATKSFDYGIYQVSVDGKDLGGPRDLYAPAVTAADVVLGNLDLTAGEHTLSFASAGKNPASGGYFLGLDGILLRPLR